MLLQGWLLLMTWPVYGKFLQGKEMSNSTSSGENKQDLLEKLTRRDATIGQMSPNEAEDRAVPSSGNPIHNNESPFGKISRKYINVTRADFEADKVSRKSADISPFGNEYRVGINGSRMKYRIDENGRSNTVRSTRNSDPLVGGKENSGYSRLLTQGMKFFSGWEKYSKISATSNETNFLGGMESSDEDENEQEKCNALYSCYDCHTARVCRPMGDGIFEEVKRIKCPPEAPNCDFETGTCMYRACPECLNEVNDFICMSDGRFPDKNCNFYHVCVNLTSEKRQCDGPREAYNADRGSCEPPTGRCGFFDCHQQRAGLLTPFSTFPNYYAYCDGSREPLVIDKCPDSTWLNATTQKCEPMCFHREGTIPDPLDCTKYYKCHKLWLTQTEWKMIKELKECPQGTGFDQKEFICVSLEQLPNCKPAEQNVWSRDLVIERANSHLRKRGLDV